MRPRRWRGNAAPLARRWRPSRRRRQDFTTNGVTRYLVVSIIIHRGTQSCFYRNGSTEYRAVRVSVFERPFDEERHGGPVSAAEADELARGGPMQRYLTTNQFGEYGWGERHRWHQQEW